eukprot:TRINITY_DN22576_c0_g1_i1.p1 TRINITY_DN22576_c0_g1~~TRINITY_DN22576_c0_g1_i1.p1  ORF type:complete len:654 (+),score=103.23 TRINITY_DN22576_c0_g1_i1:67-2028(+)
MWFIASVALSVAAWVIVAAAVATACAGARSGGQWCFCTLDRWEVLGLGTIAFMFRVAGSPLPLDVMVSLLVGFWFRCDRLLGRLACYGISRTPKAFVWSIETISLRPGFSWQATSWTRIVVSNWTWHDPVGFNGPGKGASLGSYILQVDRLTMLVDLATVYGAIFKHGTLRIDILLLEGLRFKMSRNMEAELNLWEALNLHDADVNVSIIRAKAKAQGRRGLRRKKDDGAMVQPLPPVSTEATRKASQFWRREWGDRSTFASDQTGCFAAIWKSMSTRAAKCCCTKSDVRPQETQIRVYQEFPIGDPRRRPRWGVPVRFDIRQLVACEIELWIFDFLTLDHGRRFIEPSDTKLTVDGIFLSREDLEANDERRAGEGNFGDGIHGLYLGELIWTLIGALLPKIIVGSKVGLMKNAGCAAVYSARDMAVILGAKGLHSVIGFKRLMCCERALRFPRAREDSDDCRLQVHLVMGRAISLEGKRVNVHARLELREAQTPFGSGRVIAQGESALRVWTKAPWFDERFELGAVTSSTCYLRVALFHRKTRYVAHANSHCPAARFLGEVIVPVMDLLVKNVSVARDGEIVGWFPLQATSSSSVVPPVEEERFGRLKAWIRRRRRRSRSSSGERDFYSRRNGGPRVKLGIRIVGSANLTTK